MCDNCNDPNNYIGPQPCGSCGNCDGCIEPETMVVRRSTPIDWCEQIVDIVKDAVGAPKPARCDLKILSAGVIGKSVTIYPVPLSGNNPLEYSADNVLFQDNATFNNRPCGKNKYYVRLRNFPACLASVYATVDTDCECVQRWEIVEPIESRCRDQFQEFLFRDNCGLTEYRKSTTPCAGSCQPSWVDVSPIIKECYKNPQTGLSSFRYYQTDGCGSFQWRYPNEPCGQCITPTVPFSALITHPTCDSNGVPRANGSFEIGPIVNGDKFGLYFGGSYNGPSYEQAESIPTDGIISVTGLQGYTYATGYVLRIFNGNNDCAIDRNINLQAANCQAACVQPTGTLTKQDPQCNGNAAANNGKLIMANPANVTRFQTCQDATFTCVPNYDTANTVTGNGSFTVLDNIGFSSNQEYKDYTVRMYNGSINCFRDNTVRFLNPCYNGGGQCTNPSAGTPIVTPATCSGTNINNDASIVIPSIANTNKYGYSQGTTYSGPSYGSAMTAYVAISVGNMTGSASVRNYVFRLFSSDTCWTDIPVVMPASNCTDQPCTKPDFSITSVLPTCNGTDGGTNNNGKFSIQGVTNGNKFQICLDGDFSCTPNYANSPVITGAGPHEVFASFSFSSDQTSKPFTVRVYNGSETCFTDKTVIVQNPCKSCCSMNISSIEVNNGSSTAPPPGTCRYGPILSAVFNISQGGLAYQFDGIDVFQIGWTIEKNGSIVRSGTSSPSSSQVAITFPSLENGVYTLKIQGASCTSDVSSRSFSIGVADCTSGPTLTANNNITQTGQQLVIEGAGVTQITWKIVSFSGGTELRIGSATLSGQTLNITYDTLPPGNYRMRVQGLNCNSIVSERPFVIS